jgi:acetamidase/formamidase
MRRAGVALLSSLLIPCTGAWLLGQSKSHELKLTPANIHWGYYDAKVKPVLRIAPGDTVRVETMVARGLERVRLAGASEDEIPDALKAVEEGVKDRGPGAHLMTGPIFVEGAAPGDSLEVRIQNIEFLTPWGVTAFLPNGGTIPEDFPSDGLKLIRFNERTGTADFAPGISLKLAPFFGSIGVAPPVLMGRLNSNPPGPHAGNIDNKDLVAGSTLYLPVHVPGALLSIGDGHGLQGDGEVSGTALETSLRGTFQILLRKGKKLTWPRAETPTHYMTMGLHEDLDQAAKMAVREMIDFLVSERGMKRDDAYLLCSLAADLHVTQTVDTTKGIHAMIAKSIFK